MFLLRLALCLAVLVLLIPGDPDSQQPAPRVTVLQTLAAAQSAVHDLSQICEREPAACKTGSNALGVLGSKLRYGATLVGKYFDQQTGDQTPPAAVGGGLTADEIEIPWHKPKADKSA